jgi:hypothetical protein
MIGQRIARRALHGLRGLAALTLLAGLAWLASPAGAQQGEPVDLELVLAVDASSSVTIHEFDLQMRGLSEAFRHPAVLAAIRAAGDLGIAVALVQWSDNRKQIVAVDWTKVRSEASAAGLANRIGATPRFIIGGGTAIGGAIAFSARQFEISAFEGRRKVIDVSGDGRANQGALPSRVRDEAVAQGITINGLAILNEDPTVDTYYRIHVIGGTGAFIMAADDYDDFAKAIVEKLIKEISGVPIAHGPYPGDQVAVR